MRLRQSEIPEHVHSMSQERVHTAEEGALQWPHPQGAAFPGGGGREKVAKWQLEKEFYSFRLIFLYNN